MNGSEVYCISTWIEMKLPVLTFLKHISNPSFHSFYKRLYIGTIGTFRLFVLVCCGFFWYKKYYILGSNFAILLSVLWLSGEQGVTNTVKEHSGCSSRILLLSKNFFMLPSNTEMGEDRSTFWFKETATHSCKNDCFTIRNADNAAHTK